MSDSKIEAVRSLISNFRRTRRTRSVPFPRKIKTEVLGLIGSGRTIPQLSKQIGISNVLIYQWQKDARKEKESLSHDPFIELPVEPLIASDMKSLQYRPGGVMEIRRDGLSVILRIECSVETIGFVVKEFLGGVSVC